MSSVESQKFPADDELQSCMKVRGVQVEDRSL